MMCGVKTLSLTSAGKTPYMEGPTKLMRRKSSSLIRQNKPTFKSIPMEWEVEIAISTKIQQPLEADKCRCNSNKRETIQHQIDASAQNLRTGSRVMVQLVESKEAFSHSLTSQRSSKGGIKVQTEPTQPFKTYSLSYLSKKWKLRSWDRGWLANHLSSM